MNFYRLLVFAALSGFCSLALAEEFTAKVITVLDGDTVLVLRESGISGSDALTPYSQGARNGRPQKVRLAEIDAPEKEQLFGENSKRSLSELVLRKRVEVTSQAVDDYGRLVAHLDLNGMDVNAEQVRRGMAWENSHFHRNQALVELQEQARRAPRGLWAQGNPMPPWEWRKLHPNILPSPTSSASSCGKKKYCSEMTSCAEARHYLTHCGIKPLDADGDGTPCEKLCASASQKSQN